MMINNKNNYIGSYPSEELAARIYDILAIKNRGIRARTNFFYNGIQIKKILEKNINIKCDNISDIIKQIINWIILIYLILIKRNLNNKKRIKKCKINLKFNKTIYI